MSFHNIEEINNQTWVLTPSKIIKASQSFLDRNIIHFAIHDKTQDAESGGRTVNLYITTIVNILRELRSAEKKKAAKEEWTHRETSVFKKKTNSL